MDNINGLITKDNIYRLLSDYRAYIPSDIRHAMCERVKEFPSVDVTQNWISVKDRLPSYGERILVVNEAYEARCGYNKYNCGVTVREPHLDFTFWGHKITYWQHLPEPPKEVLSNAEIH